MRSASPLYPNPLSSHLVLSSCLCLISLISLFPPPHSPSPSGLVLPRLSFSSPPAISLSLYPQATLLSGPVRVTPVFTSLPPLMLRFFLLRLPYPPCPVILSLLFLSPSLFCLPSILRLHSSPLVLVLSAFRLSYPPFIPLLTNSCPVTLVYASPILSFASPTRPVR